MPAEEIKQGADAMPHDKEYAEFAEELRNYDFEPSLELDKDQMRKRKADERMAEAIKLTRIEGWEHALHEYLAAKQTEPFTWGVNDCALFVAGAVQTIAQVDLGAGLRGKYRDERGAWKAAKKFAGAGLEALAEKLAAKFNLPEVSPLHAQRGDVALVAEEHVIRAQRAYYEKRFRETGNPWPENIGCPGPALAIVSLDGWHVVAPSPCGWARATLRDCVRAWRIG